MPPKPKVTKEAIVTAAFELIRTEGHETLGARALASALGCSTQPLLYHFPSMEAIRHEAYRTADAFHSRCLTEGLDDGGDPLLRMGLNYVRFGHEEPQLFRFLFQTNEFDGQSLQALVEGPNLAAIVGLVSQESGIDEAAAREVFVSLFVCAHGYASLLANNAMDFDEELAGRLLNGAFFGAIAQGKE